MPQASPTAIAQIREIAANQQQDPSSISDFEAKFIAEQLVRIEQYADDTHFSEKQIALIEKIHAEKVRGEIPPPVEKSANPTAIAQLREIGTKLAIDVDSQFSEFESKFVNDRLACIQESGEATTFSDKQIALIERIHAERVRGEKVEKPQSSKPKSKSKPKG